MCNTETILLPKGNSHGSKTSKFMKEQDESRLLTSLGLKAPLSEIPSFLNNLIVIMTTLSR